jgi:hypothetical protein
MPWDQGPGLRCPGALVPGFPSKIQGGTHNSCDEASSPLLFLNRATGPHRSTAALFPVHPRRRPAPDGQHLPFQSSFPFLSFCSFNDSLLSFWEAALELVQACSY